jgi:predicted site-specific integrase-resolvase
MRTTSVISQVPVKRLYSYKELAAFLGCSVPTALSYKRKGLIPYLQIGRSLIFETDKITAALERTCKK